MGECLPRKGNETGIVNRPLMTYSGQQCMISVATVMTDVFIYLENCRNVGRKIGKITKIFEELENPHDQGVI